MCGLVGRIGDEAIDPELFGRMTDALTPRGPDGRGVAFLAGGRVALGHRRLAIIDLTDAGAQPMTNEDGRLRLVFNGEIYNHAELRETLVRCGHRYASATDSETILHAYEEWGPGCVHRFRGIFAFAIYDEKSRTLFAARDHVGVKPFYYLHDRETFLFASQPRALLADPEADRGIDPDAFLDFLAYGVVPDSEAAYPGMRKLPPGHTLLYRNGRITLDRYWSVVSEPKIFDFDEARRELEKQLEESIRTQLMSDVPVATYLSGGIDSSLLTAIAAEASGTTLDTLTVGFEERESDERPYARLVSARFGTRTHESVLTRDDAVALADEVVEAFDEPFGMGAAFPMLAVAKATRDAGLKVVLSGDGADELFIGYRHYDELHARYKRCGRRTADRVRDPLRYTAARLLTGPFDPLRYYRPHEAMLPDLVQRRLVPHGRLEARRRPPGWRAAKYFDRGLGAIDAARLFDLNGYLPDEILVKVDRTTMACGVEARVPFLDPKLIELALAVDTSVHYRDGQRKSLLKAAARRWLPDEVLTQRKKGFSIPLHRWILAADWHGTLVDEVADGLLVERGLLDGDAVRGVLDDLPKEVTFQLYLAERWARRWTT